MEEENKEIKKREFIWPRVLWYIHLHALGLYGLVLFFTEAKWLTVLFALFIIFTAVIGVTVGAHRLWAHQSFTATWQIKMFLMLAHTLAGVGSIYDWVLAHRIHHKFYETDKDPYNHRKGFFYSHILSNVMTPHPDQEKFERDIDMRDVDGDSFVWIQRRFYWPLFLIVGVLLPTNAPAEYWGETIKTSVFVLCFFRLAITMNTAWLVNSGRLIWGLKPGDKYPADDNSVFFVRKSYWPNYHYMLPWDWKTGEFGSYDSGFGSFVIKMLFELGLVQSMKTASSEDIRKAFYKATSSEVSMEEVLREVKQKAETEAMKQTLEYHH